MAASLQITGLAFDYKVGPGEVGYAGNSGVAFGRLNAEFRVDAATQSLTIGTVGVAQAVRFGTALLREDYIARPWNYNEAEAEDFRVTLRATVAGRATPLEFTALPYVQAGPANPGGPIPGFSGTASGGPTGDPDVDFRLQFAPQSFDLNGNRFTVDLSDIVFAGAGVSHPESQSGPDTGAGTGTPVEVEAVSLLVTLDSEADTTPPAAPAITGFDDDTGVIGDRLTRDPTLTLSGTAEAGAVVAVRDGSAPLGSVTAGAAGGWSLATGVLASGAHAFTAVATDAAGNASPASPAFGVTVSADVFVISRGGVMSESASVAYSGPVGYLAMQFIGGSEGEVILGTDGNDFINSGAGDDAVAGGAGDDVLDGGSGSSFLLGGAGNDVFFLDGRGVSGLSAATWTTLADWEAGDQVSMFGWRAGVSTAAWAGSEGAEGYKGATLHADLDGNGTVDTSVTWAGKTQAELPAGLEFEGLLWFK